MQGADHPLVAFTQESGEDVFADLLAPEVISATASRLMASLGTVSSQSQDGGI